MCVQPWGENPVNIDGVDKSQITVVACVSAAGYCIPPMVIRDRKKLSLELTAGEVPGTFYGLSDKGWMDQELFDAWLSRHFLRYAPPTRPLLLLLHGHSSHYSPYVIRFAAKEKVIMFALPSHTTYITISHSLWTGAVFPRLKWLGVRCAILLWLKILKSG